MSSITRPWPTPVAGDKAVFRDWLKGATSPSGPGFGAAYQRVHRAIRPLTLQAELGRGSNGMVLDALAAGPAHLPERLSVVSERILDCLEFASDADRGLVGDLSGKRITPIDAEDLLRMSRLFIRGIEQLANVTATAAMVSVAEPAVQPIHKAIGESFQLTSAALVHLGDRDRSHQIYACLLVEHHRAKTFARRYFAELLDAAQSAQRASAILAVRCGYSGLIQHLSSSASALYRVALKNG